jgi:hypothetical protein
MRGQAAQSPGPARVVRMCGIAGAGKTTYAKELEAQGYVRLSIDEEVWERFGRYGVDYDPPMYEKHSAEAEAALQQRLIDLIRAGRDVVVDYSFWERSTRDRYKRLVVAAGGRWDIVYSRSALSDCASDLPHGVHGSMRTRRSQSPMRCSNASWPASKRQTAKGRRSSTPATRRTRDGGR